MRVLLIEDDPIFQQIYKDEFKSSDLELIIANDGKVGIIDAAKERPDFILLDIMMGDMDGVTTFKHLQEMPETSHIPVAFLTVVPEGVPQSLNKDPKILEGAVGYWSKDKFTPKEIAEKITAFLSAHPS